MGMGAGCCASYTGKGSLSKESIFDDFIKGSHSDDDCKQKCQMHSNCGYVITGWASSTFCVVLPKESVCDSLDHGANSCGSSGTNGVKTYKFEPTTGPPFLAFACGAL